MCLEYWKHQRVQDHTCLEWVTFLFPVMLGKAFPNRLKKLGTG